MSKNDRTSRITRKLSQLPASLKGAVEQAADGDGNVFVRANIARAVNVGGSGSSKHVSSRQTLRVRQNGEGQEVHEEIQKSGTD
jgi:hypothetical protein